MFSLVAAAALGPLTYGFGPGAAFEYELDASFTGFIPILGGQEGTARVVLGVSVLGEKSKEAELNQATSEITTAKLYFNDAQLPISKENVTSFFPKTTINLTPAGEIKKTNAPDTKPDVTLPGLDVKRFPDITYVPLVFPAGEIKVGESWKFVKAFGGSDIKYECVVRSSTPLTAEIGVKIEQDLTIFEDEGLRVVPEKDGVRTVKTHMTGDGVLVFDQKLKVFRTVLIKAKSVSTVTDLKTKEVTERKLDNEFKCTLKSPAWKTEVKQASTSWWESALGFARDTSVEAYSRAKGYALVAREGIASLLRMLLGGQA